MSYTARRIDLNTDAGESFGRWVLVDETQLFRYVTSANIACGFHAGDPVSIWRSIKLARSLGVSIGAHPGFPDLMGFGRREISVTTDELKSYVIYQLGALNAFLKVEGMRMQHVKAHGALYNMAWVREEYARALAEAVHSYDSRLVLVAPYGSAMARAAEELGLRVAFEAFIDRGYTSDGRLAPRGVPGALITDIEKILERVVSIVDKDAVTTVDGRTIEVRAHTLCIHGDSPGAIEIARAVNQKLREAGVVLKPIAELV
ncbi:MAG: LamB/YcsF family protein [Sulfolobales archaeon]|nr:LamB/YcsF family protein [Sulfolobales archaeon]